MMLFSVLSYAIELFKYWRHENVSSILILYITCIDNHVWHLKVIDKY